MQNQLNTLQLEQNLQRQGIIYDCGIDHDCPEGVVVQRTQYRGGAVEVLGLLWVCIPRAWWAAHLEACDSVQRCSPTRRATQRNV